MESGRIWPTWSALRTGKWIPISCEEFDALFMRLSVGSTLSDPGHFFFGEEAIYTEWEDEESNPVIIDIRYPNRPIEHRCAHYVKENYYELYS